MNSLLRSLGIQHPIIQAPMAGGATSAELVANVSNAGALGSLAGAMLAPDLLRQRIEEIRVLTSKPFSVNLFVLETPTPDEKTIRASNERLMPFFKQMGISQPDGVQKYCEDNRAQMAALLEMAESGDIPKQ